MSVALGEVVLGASLFQGDTAVDTLARSAQLKRGLEGRSPGLDSFEPAAPGPPALGTLPHPHAHVYNHATCWAAHSTAPNNQNQKAHQPNPTRPLSCQV
ncbi:hypothetical protein COCON_G00160330 [Conger conger]|uniref:Uncharacterized protein n=1 Tax=Conger conger TaxID=82655 RepID=A0A9Q1HVC1_CONCO|nr:hypothetical protein COCON_G00160330 [Conger conger]